jgi:hypothetical protein
MREFPARRHGSRMLAGSSAQSRIQLKRRRTHALPLKIRELKQALLGPWIVVPELLSRNRMDIRRRRSCCAFGSQQIGAS